MSNSSSRLRRLTPLQAVGKGAYGTVCSARDKLTGQRVAIKKIANCFEHIVDARRGTAEATCLTLMRLAPPQANANLCGRHSFSLAMTPV